MINQVKLFNLVNKNHSSNLIRIKKLEDNLTIQKNLTNFSLGYLGPDIKNNTIKKDSNWNKRWLKIADYSVDNLSVFVSGANKLNFHKVFKGFSFIENNFILSDIRNAQKGDFITPKEDEN